MAIKQSPASRDSDGFSTGTVPMSPPHGGKDARDPQCDFLLRCGAALANKAWKHLLHCAT